MDKKRKVDEKNLNVLIPIEMHEALSEYAEERHFSLSDAVRWALSEWLGSRVRNKK